MKIHDLVQGTPEWHAFRLEHYGASEAAAMLGLSTKVRRTELLHAKHTGVAREFSDFVQTRILDHGHEVEAIARPLVEAMIGDDLYPVTCSDGKLSASCDGLTLAGRVAFEHKQWNEALAAAVQAGHLPEEHMPQCQQVLMVTGADVVKFVVSDGTPDRWCSIDVLPDPAWFDRLRAGWSQFDRDLADYVPAEAVETPAGKAPETLPALRIEVTGAVTASNLAEFKDTALAAIRSVKRDLCTDADFADAEKAVKWCGDVESRLEAAKEHALSQTASIDALFKAIDDISAEARAVRLELDKLVTRRKVEIKDGIVRKGRQAYEAHVDALKVETRGIWLVLAAPDFAGAAKNKRSIASLQDAVDVVLANAKIAADASAKRIRENLACLAEDGAGFEFLFADRMALIVKPIDDLLLLVKARIDSHKAAEAAKEAARKAEADRVAPAQVAGAAAIPISAAPATSAAAPAIPLVRVAPATASVSIKISATRSDIDKRLDKLSEDDLKRVLSFITSRFEMAAA